jgi:PTS system mannose-specific IIA component
VTGIVIVSHGDLGRELLAAAELIAGKQDGVVTLGLQAQDAIEALPGRISEAIEHLGEVDGVLVFVDLFGGSPGNATLRCLAERDFECVSGVNLPMLLEVIMLRESMDAKDLVGQAIRAGQEGIRDLAQPLRERLGRDRAC